MFICTQLVPGEESSVLMHVCVSVRGTEARNHLVPRTKSLAVATAYKDMSYSMMSLISCHFCTEETGFNFEMKGGDGGFPQHRPGSDASILW